MADKPSQFMMAGLENHVECLFLLLLFLLAASVGMYPLTHELIVLWKSDPLRSFGVLVPFVSCALIALNWSVIKWKRTGTAWGLVPVLVSILSNRFFVGYRIELQFHSIRIDPVQPGLLLFLYFSGVILLLGGADLWKRSIFPLCLLLAVDPIPHVFTRFVDLPLQTASASVARRFAFLIGLHPTGKQLDLLFTPVLGMTIVPGCDGMRGSATMAYAALLIGYVRRYRPVRLAGLVAAAALLGYLLNFVRLCILVGYYWLASHYSAFSGDGLIVDYVIGGTIFVLVGLLAGALWLGDPGRRVPATNSRGRVPWPTILRQPRITAAAALLFVAVLSAVRPAYALFRKPDGFANPVNAAAAFPLMAGPWKATRQFTQQIASHAVWEWTEYKRTDEATVEVALWLEPDVHHAIDSLNVHGEVPLWHGGFESYAKHGVTAHFDVYTFLDHFASPGPAPTYLAETSCYVDACGMPPVQNEKFVSIHSGTRKSLSIMMKVQHPAGSTDVSAQQRAVDQALIADLLSQFDTRVMTQSIGYDQPL